MSSKTLLVPAALLAGVLVASSGWAASKPVALVKAAVVPPEASLLDVRITVFEPAEDFFPEVRQAEARYIPVGLKRVFEEAGFWGAVRVVPDTGGADLTISGAVLACPSSLLIQREWYRWWPYDERRNSGRRARALAEITRSMGRGAGQRNRRGTPAIDAQRLKLAQAASRHS